MKWLNGILRRTCKSRLRYLMKFVSVLDVILRMLADSEKKSSGTIAPNRRPWFRLKDTTPFPNNSGLILKSRFTTFSDWDLFSLTVEAAACVLEELVA